MRAIASACVRWAARSLLAVVYRVSVRGLEHYHAAGPRVLIVANHVSFLDALLLALFLPGRLTFAIAPGVAGRWWVRPFLGFVEVIRVDPATPLSARALVAVLRHDRKVVVFPEGRITVTGSLMKIYEGPAFVADRSDAVILPVRIAGAELTPFARIGDRHPRWFPRITIMILPPRRLDLPASLRGGARRRRAGTRLTELMTEMIFVTTDHRLTVPAALLAARRLHGGGHVAAEDRDRRPSTYRQLLTRTFALRSIIETMTRPGENVGVLLPSSLAALVTMLALQFAGRTPAMLNYTAGVAGMRGACRAAGIRTLLTSRRFVSQASLSGVVDGLGPDTAVAYLEDLADRITRLQRLTAWLQGLVPHLARIAAAGGTPDEPAVVLFTAGSEGAPKGVVLSHANLLANRAQVAACIDFGPRDVLLNALPLFHAFGLTTGTILPLLSGVRVFFYPSPLDYRTIPEVAYDIGATVLFGTNAFLAGYARFAHPYDFYRVRYVFAGAERLEAGTREAWIEKFGIRILEGYGATETGPVLATNTPMRFRSGTVGRLLPGIEHRLEPVEGLPDGGRLGVRGPNVMLGYLRSDNPGIVVPPGTDGSPGWYDTGDIVRLDEDGFITILGRARRFVKIAGEMISLARVEELAQRAWPGSRHAAVSLPDPRRGEQIILLTEHQQAGRGELLRRAREVGLPETHAPSAVLTVEALPVLPAGKIDYVSAQGLAEASIRGPRHTAA
jgi:acyl-[acyl-carrier-protein]-phospholipid O-acyltransferase / long-chain-fatty-acid--[acyl-carrier-protein] ligase